MPVKCKNAVKTKYKARHAYLEEFRPFRRRLAREPTLNQLTGYAVEQGEPTLNQLTGYADEQGEPTLNQLTGGPILFFGPARETVGQNYCR